MNWRRMLARPRLDTELLWTGLTWFSTAGASVFWLDSKLLLRFKANNVLLTELECMNKLEMAYFCKFNGVDIKINCFVNTLSQTLSHPSCFLSVPWCTLWWEVVLSRYSRGPRFPHMKIGLAYWLSYLVNLELLLLKSCLDKSCRTLCLDKSRSLLILKDTVAIVLFVDVLHIDL